MRADPFAEGLERLDELAALRRSDADANLAPAPIEMAPHHLGRQLGDLRENRERKPLQHAPLAPIGLRDFLSMEFPPREMVLSPWLPLGGLAMLYAPRGCGKTHVALEIAYAAATGGSFLKWQAPEPRSVLIIDGEMPAGTLQERLARIAATAGVEPPHPTQLRVLASDLHQDGLPDLSNSEDQSEYTAALGDAQLIIVDNLSSLCRSGRENEAESWLTVQGWALARRREGRAVLFVHHSGKGGGQRGTSE